MATVELQKKSPSKSDLVSGADILVQSLVNHGVERSSPIPAAAACRCIRRSPASATSSARSCPATNRAAASPPRAIARSTGKVGVVHGHQRPRRDEPRHRHRRRQARQHSADRHHRPGADRRDRHRRVPGNADRRSLPRHHQAPLPGDRRERRRPRGEGGVHHRHDRPARPGADRHAEGRAAWPRCVPDYDAPLNLPGYKVENRRKAKPEQIKPDRRGDQAGQAADHLRRRRHHHRRGQRRAPHARQEDRHSGHDDRDGPRRLPGDRSAVARHARHARLGLRELRRRTRPIC